jgi:hypothetical protein
VPPPDKESEEEKERHRVRSVKAAEDRARDRAVASAVEESRKKVLEAAKDGQEAVDKAVREGRKAVKAAYGAQEMLPLFHDGRLGNKIDDCWTIVQLLELALPSDLNSSKKEIPGLNGGLGAVPFPIKDKELHLVKDAATEFIKLVKLAAEVGFTLIYLLQYCNCCLGLMRVCHRLLPTRYTVAGRSSSLS